jgi:Chaperone for protein-folding within the ER, fungal
MQFQHGSYTKASNGSLVLTPIAVDGRQLLSDPCTDTNAIYTRWNVTEVFKVRSLK